MGTIFRKQMTKAFPAGAEVFTKGGQQWARWTNRRGKQRKARVTTGKDGSPRLLTESRVYFAKYRDGAGQIQVKSTECRSEQAAQQWLNEQELKVDRIKAKVM